VVDLNIGPMARFNLPMGPAFDGGEKEEEEKEF